MVSILVNGKPRVISDSAPTLASLVRELALEGKRIAIERNGEIVPRSFYADTMLVEGDRLEIVGAVGGG